MMTYLESWNGAVCYCWGLVPPCSVSAVPLQPIQGNSRDGQHPNLVLWVVLTGWLQRTVGFSYLAPLLFQNGLEMWPFKTFDNAGTALRVSSPQQANFHWKLVYVQNHFQESCPKGFLWSALCVVSVVTPEVWLDGNLSCSISLGPGAFLGMHDLQCRKTQQNCCPQLAAAELRPKISERQKI